MDLVEHLNTYVSLLHISFDQAVTKNSLLLLCNISDITKSFAENVSF